ncbi:HAD family hydrolase [Pseudomonas asplenii]|uniref:HAD family hydrolase n=1 Tax=Pseudomonas asplenii TaxID=53407 RepID=UPI00036D91A2|nr:HAD family hydrolase [Pseudomonas fuscovaginae]
MLPSAAIFDAFGTLLDIKNRTHPYRMLLREGARQGRAPRAEDIRSLMTWNCSIGEAAEQLGIRISAERMEVIQAALADELESLVPFADGFEAVEMFRDAGVRVGICSNLTAAYGTGVKRLLSAADAFALSYEIGALKPEPLIYQAMCDSLGVQTHRYVLPGAPSILMIGDSPRCDRDGPRTLGISGHLLTRGRGGIENLVQFAELVLQSSGH